MKNHQTTNNKSSMYKRLLWLFLLIPFQVTGQDVDYPATSLVRMQKAFTAEAAKQDYKKMVMLMDSMMTAETAINRKARPRLLKTYTD